MLAYISNCSSDYVNPTHGSHNREHYPNEHMLRQSKNS